MRQRCGKVLLKIPTVNGAPDEWRREVVSWYRSGSPGGMYWISAAVPLRTLWARDVSAHYAYFYWMVLAVHSCSPGQIWAPTFRALEKKVLVSLKFAWAQTALLYSWAQVYRVGGQSETCKENTARETGSGADHDFLKTGIHRPSMLIAYRSCMADKIACTTTLT